MVFLRILVHARLPKLSFGIDAVLAAAFLRLLMGDEDGWQKI